MTRSYTNKAMRSFFGAREGGQVRPNNINTPGFLFEAILNLWPEGIELDPCSNAYSWVPARNRILGKTVDGKLCLVGVGDWKYRQHPNGLSIDWPNFTYANPPFNTLREWLYKPVPGREHLLLAPCRPNRRWYCEAIGTFPVTCWLKPFPFDGHTQAYPTPLGLSYWGTRIKEFNRIFSRYGVVGRMIINV